MINDINLEKTVADFNAKNLPRACWSMAISFEIIAESFGIDFITREFLDGKRELNFTNIDDPFFFHLSDLLWRLKGCEGFQEFIEREKTKSKEPLYYELYCASWLLSISDSVEFKQLSGTKGDDYDLFAKSCMGFEEFYVEVKARTREFESTSALQNFLKKAKKQLPPINGITNSSAIMFKIMASNNSIPQSDLDYAIKRFIENTSKISHVIYL